MATAIFAPTARLADGWSGPLERWIDGDGLIAPAGNAASEMAKAVLPGPVVPALPNLHSHAFQRGLAGLAETRSSPGDDFWSWRTAMYRFLDRLTPDDVLAIATQLYVEMARAGYARVCEFHYLHNAPDGRPYAVPSIMAEALIEAAATAGIGLTLIPVLYTSSGFGGRAPEPAQRRFVQTVDDYLALIERLRALSHDGGFELGIGFHSLRAVTPEQMRLVLDASAAGPIHIHVAEQVREVEDCQAWSGARPVAWLLGEVGLDARWCLVHATHMVETEIAAVAASGATVAICPTTEANLGDGFFETDRYFANKGRWGIGSDSHVSVDPREELRLLDYGQRLRSRRRALGGTADVPNIGAWLWMQAAGAAAPTGVPAAGLEPGQRADLLVLDSNHPALAARSGDALLDSLIFVNAGAPPVRELWVGGRRVVAEGQHPHQEQAAQAYAATLARLRAAA